MNTKINNKIYFSSNYSHWKIVNKPVQQLQNRTPKTDNLQKHYIRKQFRAAEESQLLIQSIEKIMRMIGF